MEGLHVRRCEDATTRADRSDIALARVGAWHAAQCRFRWHADRRLCVFRGIRDHRSRTRKRCVAPEPLVICRENASRGTLVSLLAGPGAAAFGRLAGCHLSFGGGMPNLTEAQRIVLAEMEVKNLEA